MPYFDRYVKLSTSNDIETTLVESHNHLVQLIQSFSEEEMNYQYAKGKWTIKEVVQHLIDTERIFVYRALRFARNDSTELPGYEHNQYVQESNAKEKFKDQLLNEFVAVHRATIMFFNQLPAVALSRTGIASKEKLTVEMIAHIIAGHTQHHLSVIEQKYLPTMKK
jgi:uncharacterized damage-inducible protein DinB